MLHRSGLVVASALAAFAGSCVVEGTMSANARGRGSTGPYNRIHRNPRSASPPSDRMKVLKTKSAEELEVEPDEKDHNVPHITSFGQLSTRDGSNSSLASTDCQSPLPNSTPARARCQQRPPQDGEQADNLLVQRCGPGDEEERPTTRRSTRTGFLGRLGNVCRRRRGAAEQETTRGGEGELVEATGEGELAEGDNQQPAYKVPMEDIVTAVVLSNALCFLPLAGKLVEKVGPQWLQQVCGIANQTEAAAASATWPH